jgi:hypothetical protein
MSVIHYEHHGRTVAVKSHLKGKHREHCLCGECSKFKPDDREKNCPIANAFFSLCALTGVVSPIWECSEFRTKKDILGDMMMEEYAHKRCELRRAKEAANE